MSTYLYRIIIMDFFFLSKLLLDPYEFGECIIAHHKGRRQKTCHKHFQGYKI